MSGDTATGTESERLFARARELFPGGVNSPVRAFGSVGGSPNFIDRATGPFIWDVDGRRRIDYVSSWGAVILGHAEPTVVAAIQEAAAKGTSYGAPTEAESRLAERIRHRMPSIEKMRFTSSGTEATMSAVRLARAFTSRSKILKFEGCYHGHSDALLTRAGSGVATLSLPGSAGVPPEATRDTIVAPYNDVAAAERVFDEFGDRIAAVLVEPVAANMGVVAPVPGFLETLRTRATDAGALLVFDEVITGFRIAIGGAQQAFGVTPDLTCLGKIVGGGLPVGVFGGRSDIMATVAPDGPMYQAGTLSGNPVAMAAGEAALAALDDAAYARLDAMSERLESGIERVIAEAGVAASVSRVASLLTLFWTPDPPRDFETAKRGDADAFARFFHVMLDRGINLPPSPFEAWFLTLAHTEEEIDATVEAVRASLG